MGELPGQRPPGQRPLCTETLRQRPPLPPDRDPLDRDPLGSVIICGQQWRIQDFLKEDDKPRGCFPFNYVSVCPQGGLPHCMQGYTHPLGRHPPGQTPPHRVDTPWDTVNKRAVRIILECNLGILFAANRMKIKKMDMGARPSHPQYAPLIMWIDTTSHQ